MFRDRPIDCVKHPSSILIIGFEASDLSNLPIKPSWRYIERRIRKRK